MSQSTRSRGSEDIDGQGPPDGTTSKDSVHFEFEGRVLLGRKGESIAAALFRNGIRTLSHSIKYNRPRSIHCGRGRCSFCLMEVNGCAGVKTCVEPLVEGTRVRRQDFRPWWSPVLTKTVDRVRFPAGFYFRFFTRPTIVRKMFLGTLRRMAGVGRIYPDADSPGQIDFTRPFAIREQFDVVVVGGGLSGLTAATSSASEGARVLLVDENNGLGGSEAGYQSEALLAQTRDELVESATRSEGIRILPGTTAQGIYGNGDILLKGIGHPRMRLVSAPAIVLAMGTNDVIPLFANNDYPGVFGQRALRLFLERDRIKLGSSAVVYGTGPNLNGVRALLRHHGISISAVVSPAADETGPSSGATRGQLIGVSGRGWVSGAVIETSSGRQNLKCDLVCTAFRGQPSLELAQQAGFTFAMSNTAVEADRVMTPDSCERALDGTTCLIAGQQSGESEWTARVDSGRRMGLRATEAAR